MINSKDKKSIHALAVKDTRGELRKVVQACNNTFNVSLTIDEITGDGSGCHLVIQRGLEPIVKVCVLASKLHGRNTWSAITKATAKKADFVIINMYDDLSNYQHKGAYVIENSSKELPEFIDAKDFKAAPLDHRIFMDVQNPKKSINHCMNLWGAIVPYVGSKLK